MKISVTIPVFNDTAALTELLQELFHVVDAKNWEVQVLLVDDGSRSDIWRELQHIRDAHPYRTITLLRLARNFGQHAATLCGILHSHHSIAVTMDADLQHPPGEIPALLAHLSNNSLDLVYGTALAGHPWWRRITSYGFNILTRPIAARHIHGSSFRAIRLPLHGAPEHWTSHDFHSLDSALLQAGLRADVIAVTHHQRRYGKSGYGPAQLLMLAVRPLILAYPKSRIRAVVATVLLGMTGMFVWSSQNTNEFALTGVNGLFIGMLAIIGALLLLLNWHDSHEKPSGIQPVYQVAEQRG